jgi:hypothetical protein
MSIFKASFPKGVQKQLKARQRALVERNSNSIQYFGARTAWIKMTSAVEVGGDGGQLAKNNVLLGGALYNGNLRSGVGIDASNAYSLNTAGGTQHRLGIRPMPGITGIDVKSKSAYGSLREVVVNFNCWDIKQLEELELLYMRPGYSVLVEWGWMPYLENGDDEGNNSKLSSIVEFTTEVENGKGPKEEIWKQIHLRAAKSGNYDAIYGFVKNYSWSARPDGGYDCTTTIITMGELLESLKVNFSDVTTDVAQKGTFGLFKTSPDQFAADGPVNKSYQKCKLAGILHEMYLIAESKISDDKTSQDVTLESTKGNINCNFFRFDIIRQTTSENDDKSSFVDDNTQIYMPLKHFIEVFNRHINLQDSETEGQPNITEVSLTLGEHQKVDGKFPEGNPEGELLCLGNIYQVSTDPFICQIKNNAYLKPETLNLKGNGTENIIKIINGLGKNYNYFWKDDYKDKQYGIIGNIYVNLAYIYNLITDDGLAAQDKKEKREIGMYDFLKNLMTGINTAIGNVANFDIHVDPIDSKSRIIDINYVDESGREEAYENAFELELHSLKSTVRSYKLESKIFPEQSAVVAIGAQAKGGALAQGNNTLIDFNQNLKDRIVPAKTIEDLTKSEEDDKTKIDNLKNNMSTLLEYFTALDTSSGFLGLGWEWLGASSFDTSKSSAYSGALRDIISYYQSLIKDNNNNRAIIPTGLSIEMDGIGGIIIGNLFKIPLDLLPRGYKGDGAGPAKIAYVVMRMGHSVTNNDWVTKLESQFIILDDPEKSKKGMTQAEALSRITSDLKRAKNTTVPTSTSPAGSSTSVFSSPIIGNTGNISSTSVTPIKNSGAGSVAENNQKYPVLVKNETWKREYNSTVQKYAKVSAFSPVADSLRKQLDKSYIIEKGNEISSNGDITESLKSAVLTFQSKLKSTAGFDFIKNKPIRITAGNDTYHRTYGDKRNRTTHCRGLAIDIGTREFNQTQINNIMNLLRNSGFTYVIYHGGSALHIHANISTT